jgi:hypothetical protein
MAKDEKMMIGFTGLGNMNVPWQTTRNGLRQDSNVYLAFGFQRY